MRHLLLFSVNSEYSHSSGGRKNTQKHIFFFLTVNFSRDFSGFYIGPSDQVTIIMDKQVYGGSMLISDVHCLILNTVL